MRRVEHLVPRRGEPAQSAIQVPLGLWLEEELRLLDEEDDARDPELVAGLDARHEG